MASRDCRGARRAGWEPRQKTQHPIDELGGTVGNHIGPGLGFIAVEDMPVGARKTSTGAAASRWARACACCHEVAKEVRPPIALPASAAKADMYAASIGLARCGISCRLVTRLLAPRTGIPPILRGCMATIARLGSFGNDKSRFVCVVEPVNRLR